MARQVPDRPVVGNITVDVSSFRAALDRMAGSVNAVAQQALAAGAAIKAAMAGVSAIGAALSRSCDQADTLDAELMAAMRAKLISNIEANETFALGLSVRHSTAVNMATDTAHGTFSAQGPPKPAPKPPPKPEPVGRRGIALDGKVG